MPEVTQNKSLHKLIEKLDRIQVDAGLILNQDKVSLQLRISKKQKQPRIVSAKQRESILNSR